MYASLRDTQGLCGGMLTPLSTCSRHVCFVKLRVWLEGDLNVFVNLLTPCMLRDPQGLGGGDVNVIVNMGAAWKKGIDAITLSSKIGHGLQSSLMSPKQNKTQKAQRQAKRHENASCQGASRPYSIIPKKIAIQWVCPIFSHFPSKTAKLSEEWSQEGRCFSSVQKIWENRIWNHPRYGRLWNLFILTNDGIYTYIHILCIHIYTLLGFQKMHYCYHSSGLDGKVVNDQKSNKQTLILPPVNNIWKDHMWCRNHAATFGQQSGVMESIALGQWSKITCTKVTISS